MPKRRMTPARKAAIAKWQKAGANSRKGNVKPWSASELAAPRKQPTIVANSLWAHGNPKRLIPTGKNTLLYHRTRSSSADSIVKSRKWISGAREFSGRRGYSWFSKGGPTGASGFYGSALVTVSVPRKLVQSVGYNRQDGIEFVQVKNSVLKGRKVRRIH